MTFSVLSVAKQCVTDFVLFVGLEEL